MLYIGELLIPPAFATSYYSNINKYYVAIFMFLFESYCLFAYLCHYMTFTFAFNVCWGEISHTPPGFVF